MVRNFNFKHFIPATIIIIVTGFLIFTIYNRFSEPKEVSNDEFQEKISLDSYDNILVRDESKVLTEIHQMANTLIVADEIWGEIEITEERINALILEVKASKFDDKDLLLTMLYRWKERKFSLGVHEHNYLWNRLGGSLGMAVALRKEVILAMEKENSIEWRFVEKDKFMNEQLKGDKDAFVAYLKGEGRAVEEYANRLKE